MSDNTTNLDASEAPVTSAGEGTPIPVTFTTNPRPAAGTPGSHGSKSTKGGAKRKASTGPIEQATTAQPKRNRTNATPTSSKSNTGPNSKCEECGNSTEAPNLGCKHATKTLSIEATVIASAELLVKEFLGNMTVTERKLIGSIIVSLANARKTTERFAYTAGRKEANAELAKLAGQNNQFRKATTALTAKLGTSLKKNKMLESQLKDLRSSSKKPKKGSSTPSGDDVLAEAARLLDM